MTSMYHGLTVAKFLRACPCEVDRGVSVYRPISGGKVMKVRGLVAVIATVLVLAGSGNAWARSSVKSPPAPDGFVTTNVKGAGFSVALPVTWLALDPKSPSATALLQRGVEKNPKLKAVLSQWSSLRSSVKLMAFDAAATTFASNLIVLPTPFDKSVVQQPRSVVAALKAQLGSTFSVQGAHKVRVAGVAALEADYTAQLDNANGTPTTAYASAYFLPTKKGVIVLEFTSATPPSIDNTLQVMVHSLKML